MFIDMILYVFEKIKLFDDDYKGVLMLMVEVMLLLELVEFIYVGLE